MNLPVETREVFEQNALSTIHGQFPDPKVLQLGSRVIYGPKDSVRRLFPSPESFTGVDYVSSEGVDLVADCHTLSRNVPRGTFDVVWSDATLEHLENPWIAVGEMATVLKVGGYAVHITHQSFPIHSFPNDYWRFSTDSLQSLFSKPYGFETLSAKFCWPVALRSEAGYPRSPAESPCFIHAMIFARKIGEPIPELAALRDVLYKQKEGK